METLYHDIDFNTLTNVLGKGSNTLLGWFLEAQKKQYLTLETVSYCEERNQNTPRSKYVIMELPNEFRIPTR